MEIFVRLKKLLSILGIQRTNQPTIKIKNHIRSIFFIVMLTSMTAGIFWFVAFEAKTFTDLANPIYAVCHCITCGGLYAAMLQRSDQFADLFEIYTAEIATRRSQENYVNNKMTTKICGFCR